MIFFFAAPKDDVTKPTLKRKLSESNDVTVPLKKTSKPITVVFTGMDPDYIDKLNQRLSNCNVHFGSDIKKCNALITNKIARTQKFLYAMAKGIPIASTEFMEAIIKNEAVSTDIHKYILRDLENEEKYNFSLARTIQEAQTKPILNGLIFYMTPNTFPDNSTLKGELHGLSSSKFVIWFICRYYNSCRWDCL